MASNGDRYGYAHKQLRAKWAPLVAAGTVVCWRCGRLIPPGAPWDLGHSDVDPTAYRGPEHAGPCNRRAGAVKGNRMRGRRRAATPPPPPPPPDIRQPPTAHRW